METSNSLMYSTKLMGAFLSCLQREHARHQEVLWARSMYIKAQSEVKELNKDQTQALLLDVGGVPLHTTRGTFTDNPECNDSMLKFLFSGYWPDESDPYNYNQIFLDRDGKMFRHILEYLRAPYDNNQGTPLSSKMMASITLLPPGKRPQLLREAQYFSLDNLQFHLLHHRKSLLQFYSKRNGCFLSLDEGLTWIPQEDIFPFIVYAVTLGNVLIGVTVTGEVYRSEDGRDWIEVANKTVDCPASTGSGVGAVLGKNGDLLISLDTGLTWHPCTSLPAGHTAVTGIIACGENLVAYSDDAEGKGKLLLSVDWGATWEVTRSEAKQDDLFIVHQPNVVVATAYFYHSLVSTDAGRTWVAGCEDGFHHEGFCDGSAILSAFLTDSYPEKNVVIYSHSTHTFSTFPLYNKRTQKSSSINSVAVLGNHVFMSSVYEVRSHKTLIFHGEWIMDEEQDTCTLVWRDNLLLPTNYTEGFRVCAANRTLVCYSDAAVFITTDLGSTWTCTYGEPDLEDYSSDSE